MQIYNLPSHLYFICICIISFKGVSQNTFIPDNNFEQALIDLGYDVGPIDNTIPTANISNVTGLDLSPFVNKIIDLTGIEDFTALTMLNFENHLVTSVNLNNNTNLQQLFCNNNQLNSLNLTNNQNLEVLWCNNNLLTSLVLNTNLKLRALDCSFNQINNLDVTENIFLIDFVCENNLLTSLDITNNSSLNRYQCGNNLLTNLDISINTNLSYLSCEQNFLSTLDVTNNRDLVTLICSENQLSELDLRENSSLIELNCSNNNLCRLNVKNGNNNNIFEVDFSSNINLNCVVVDNPSNTHTNWIPNTFLNYVSNINDCSFFVNVDTLSDVVTNTFYTLPSLTYGNYFTQSGGNGVALFSGDTITTSQLIYIYNESICANNESSFYVLKTDKDYFIPKYFTPNNDGRHDVWQVFDNTNSIKTITVFDRYGKLLKTLAVNSQGWDGTFNGTYLQTDNYWYVITFNTGEKITGYFALKR